MASRSSFPERDDPGLEFRHEPRRDDRHHRDARHGTGQGSWASPGLLHGLRPRRSIHLSETQTERNAIGQTGGVDDISAAASSAILCSASLVRSSAIEGRLIALASLFGELALLRFCR